MKNMQSIFRAFPPVSLPLQHIPAKLANRPISAKSVLPRFPFHLIASVYLSRHCKRPISRHCKASPFTSLQDVLFHVIARRLPPATLRDVSLSTSLRDVLFHVIARRVAPWQSPLINQDRLAAILRIIFYLCRL